MRRSKDPPCGLSLNPRGVPGQRMLGHKDAAMTLNVYASLFEDDLDDVSNRP